MDPSIEAMATQYRASRASSQSARELVLELYRRYIKDREQSLMDAVAASVAVNALFLADRIDMSSVTPQMEEAFHLAYPNVDLSSLADRSPTELSGFLSGWKGKYFEVLVRDELNAGEWIGDIHLNPGQMATLAQSATQPGWDLQILDDDGTILHELQLKATQSLSYVKEALQRYPDIDVISTDEVLGSGSDAIQGVFGSGFTESALEDAIHAPMEALLDSPLEELVETILPALPFILIAAGEGRKVLMGRKTFELAMRDGLYRSARAGAAIGVGALVVFLDGGLLSLPASFLTRMGFDRYSATERSTKFLNTRIQEIQPLADRHRMLGAGPP